MAKDRPNKKTPEQRQAEAAQGMAAHLAEQAAINKNMLRLRALRLAHEAANPPAPAVKPARARKQAAAK